MANITLAIDDKLVAKARAFAKSKGTTLNALVRSQLEGLMDQEKRQEEARRGLLELIENSTARIGPDYKFNRDELYESPTLSRHKHSGLRGRRKRG